MMTKKPRIRKKNRSEKIRAGIDKAKAIRGKWGDYDKRYGEVGILPRSKRDKLHRYEVYKKKVDAVLNPNYRCWSRFEGST